MQSNSKKITDHVAAVRDFTLRTIAESRARLTPPVLEKILMDRFGLSRKQFKSIIKGLVASGDLTYTYEYGSTFLEHSFARPVRISKHFVLQPPGLQLSSATDDVVVSIKPGAAFGVGNHPTTRLAMNGIEFVIYGGPALDGRQFNEVLDIGTGSGVLLISAVLGGFKSGLGIDIDACARSEAAANASINGVANRVSISGESLADIRQRFSMILANLRYPTLRRLRFQIKERSAPNCFLVLSGIRDHERDDLIYSYQKMQFRKRWAANELGWSGVVLQKSG